MLWIALLWACSGEPPAPTADVTPPSQPAQPFDPAASKGPGDDELRKLFAPLPKQVESPDNPLTPEKIALGRMLYHENRLSKNQKLSCNSCHDLGRFGVDGQPTSKGHRDQKGTRNSPTVYNAALHTAQFWDGRVGDVESQAQGQMLNPVEMAMPDDRAVVTVLKSIPGYAEPFSKAFPDDKDPITFENTARAIAAFERTLTTPGRFDEWLAGDADALTPEEKRGLQRFVDAGCTSCHNGAGLGGNMYQKVGVVHPYETADLGRYEVTKSEADKHVFKVPSLRNVAETGPYFHDGSVATLEEAVKKMAWHQLGKELTPNEVASIVTFLKALTSTPSIQVVKKPELPPSGPKTPAPEE